MNEPEYDRFLTLGDAAACLMYKERVLHGEKTPLKIYYTDRQGVPVAIDITGKEGGGEINRQQQFFCPGSLLEPARASTCMSYGLKRIEKNSKQNLEKRHK